MGQIRRYHIGHIDDLDEDRLMTDTLFGEPVLIVREGATLHAVAAHCPHQYAPLIGGEVKGGVLTCLLHGWRFRLCDGKSPDNDFIRIASWPCGVEDDGRIWVEALGPPPGR